MCAANAFQTLHYLLNYLGGTGRSPETRGFRSLDGLEGSLEAGSEGALEGALEEASEALQARVCPPTLALSADSGMVTVTSHYTPEAGDREA